MSALNISFTRPTPELVHGVEAGSPALAETLRRCGYFSGPSKGVRALAPVRLARQVKDRSVVVTVADDDDTHQRLH